MKLKQRKRREFSYCTVLIIGRGVKAPAGSRKVWDLGRKERMQNDIIEEYVPPGKTHIHFSTMYNMTHERIVDCDTNASTGCH